MFHLAHILLVGPVMAPLAIAIYSWVCSNNRAYIVCLPQLSSLRSVSQQLPFSSAVHVWQDLHVHHAVIATVASA